MSYKPSVCEEDITGVLGDTVTVCLFQTRSPFYDECAPRSVAGRTILTCDLRKLKERTAKILSLAKCVKRFRAEVDIIVFPEYALHYHMQKELQDFADSNNVIFLGTYYDDRDRIDSNLNPNFRRNVLMVILPKKQLRGSYVKLERTIYEQDFLDDTPEDRFELVKLSWLVGKDERLFLQVFICQDFLEHFEQIDRHIGGIVVVPMCSPAVEEFKAPAQLYMRPHADSKNNRCIFLCNAVSIPEQKSALTVIGGSRIFGPYPGDLPILPGASEGGIIATVNAQNLITRPLAIPSSYNIVIEDPVAFSIREEKGDWTIGDVSYPSKRDKWVVDPRALSVLGVGTYFSFARLRSYYTYRVNLQSSLTKCWGVVGEWDVIATCVAEEHSDALMYIYPGRSDLAASLSMELYFHVSARDGFIKYKGYEVPAYKEAFHLSRTELLPHRRTIYDLITGSTQATDEKSVQELMAKGVLLGKAEPVDVDRLRQTRTNEFLIGVLLPTVALGEEGPAEVFEREIIRPHLVKNQQIKDILYSAGGAGGRGRINLHFLIHFTGDLWECANLVLCGIHKPLTDRGIEVATRIIPIGEYLSDSEYETLLDTYVGDPSLRRRLREIQNAIVARLGRTACYVRRLDHDSLLRLIEMFESNVEIARILSVDVDLIEEKLARFVRGWINGTAFPQTTEAERVREDMRDLYQFLVTRVEGALLKSVREKREEVGDERFQTSVSAHAEKPIDLKDELGALFILCSIWNAAYPDNPIVDNNLGNEIRLMQKDAVDRIRNSFSHPSPLLTERASIGRDIDKVAKALATIIRFIRRYPSIFIGSTAST